MNAQESKREHDDNSKKYGVHNFPSCAVIDICKLHEQRISIVLNSKSYAESSLITSCDSAVPRKK
ncbi:hypothetical protein GCM10007377_09080 [Galliscardovia ingluviei]|uniref:Uncharacterized protein n=1 Tax=Galliscardovia ingluviei TaxID=1769422 RepID=A0A8J3AGL6_9BIFI|nr:hypothetical protein GCM10007377_09080 [Galliscardovia ingluviei]